MTDPSRRVQNRRGSSTPMRVQIPVFQSSPRGHLGPGREADHRRLHRRPDVDERVAAHEHVRMVDRLGQPRFLRAVDEVVEQHAETAAGSRPEPPDHFGEVVGAVEQLDDDALDAQVVAPHPFDQLGVVGALDEDAAGPGDPGARSGHRHRTRRRASSRRRRRRGRGHEGHLASLDVEAAIPEADHPVSPVGVAQRHGAAAGRHDHAPQTGAALGDLESGDGLDPGMGPALRLAIEVDGSAQDPPVVEGVVGHAGAAQPPTRDRIVSALAGPS